MYHVSAQGPLMSRMINVHYYYYYSVMSSRMSGNCALDYHVGFMRAKLYPTLSELWNSPVMIRLIGSSRA